jgi:hypothetical protein
VHSRGARRAGGRLGEILATLFRAARWVLILVDRQRVDVFTDDKAWDVLEEIPNDSAAGLLLIEHHWAVPLRDAIASVGGFRISDERHARAARRGGLR